jgi:Domain of unknown function (DUF6471)
MPKNIYKTNELTRKYEEKAKNLLKGELKRRGVTYSQLVEKLEALGVQETERNLEPIRKELNQFEAFVASRLSMMRIMARRMKAAAVLA